MTYLTVPIKVVDIEDTRKAIARAVEAHAEMIELRLDYLKDADSDIVRQVVTIAKDTGLPVIATCRASWEGGEFFHGEKSRQMIFKAAVRAGADYVDIEARCREDGGVQPKELQPNDLEHKELQFKIIRSYHDFEGVPNDFAQQVAHVTGSFGDVGKVVVTANRISDCFCVLDLLHSQSIAGNEFIAMAMGDPGVMTRLLAKKLGALVAFASLAKGAESASGQVSVADMRELYRWDAIGANTSIYGIIGYPVGHSMSPAIHNHAFDVAGYDGLYVPLLIEPTRDEFIAFMDGVRERKWLSVRGLSVTIPHKANALEYVRNCGGHLEPLAAKIGAVNTLTIDKAGNVAGYNTDYAGALDAITGKLGINHSDLKGLPTAVVGAGGVARAIVAGLSDAGAAVTIYNRTESKAQALAMEFDCQWQGLKGLQSLDAKLVINCSSIGMYPEIEASPVPAERLKSDMVVFDTVYNPMETLLLRNAREVGATIVDGVSMFVNQAAAQFELFTGEKPPLDEMREIVERRLSLG